MTAVNEFLSTPSARRATLASRSFCTSALNFYPRPPRGGRLGCCGEVHAVNDFYPRPPRGGRHAEVGVHALAKGISIHALREEGDTLFSGRSTFMQIFLSTPSARRATKEAEQMWWAEENFYPRPPRGGRPLASKLRARYRVNFYPRPPRGGRPPGAGPQEVHGSISIHALREEGDMWLFCNSQFAI